jgi:hypothetical protein
MTIKLSLRACNTRSRVGSKVLTKSDTEAAGRVLLAMKQVNASTPRELLQTAGMEPKRFCQ